jgi:hypothetical protein
MRQLLGILARSCVLLETSIKNSTRTVQSAPALVDLRSETS